MTIALTDVERKVAGGMAQRIRDEGHFQGKPGSDGVCLLMGQHRLSELPYFSQERIFAAILETAGATVEVEHSDRVSSRVMVFNDMVPTDVVLDVLAAIEVG